MLLFVNDTSTAGSYTYGHTLSLPDALPTMKMWKPWRSAAVVIFAATSWAAGTVAMPYEEELEEEDDQHIVRLVRDFHVIAADGQLDPRTAQVDLAFVEQMGRHHKGAVDMAETYLEDPRGRKQVLRR